MSLLQLILSRIIVDGAQKESRDTGEIGKFERQRDWIDKMKGKRRGKRASPRSLRRGCNRSMKKNKGCKLNLLHELTVRGQVYKCHVCMLRLFKTPRFPRCSQNAPVPELMTLERSQMSITYCGPPRLHCHLAFFFFFETGRIWQLVTLAYV